MNLIANDLVIVSPMSAMSGYVTYLEYTAGKKKGETEYNALLNSPFKLGDVDSNYTSSRVVETFTGNGTKTAFELAWDAAILDNGALAGGKVVVDGTEITTDTSEAQYYSAATASGVTTITFHTAPANTKEVRIAYVYDNVVVPQKDIPTLKVELKNIPLLAKARRIAVYYSQIAA